MKISLIIMEGKYSAVYADDYSFHVYYIITFSSYTYALQSDFSIDGQVISSGEIVCGGNYFFPINSNPYYYVLLITQLFL